MGDRRRDSMVEEEAPHSRLFIIGSKQLQEEEVRNAFKVFGSIREVKVVRDRITGEYKGIFYVKYAKTSDAAKALENMKGKMLGGRSLKVMIASSREQGSVRDENEEDHVKRLFVVVPKTACDNEIYDYFKQFGELEYASILKNKDTKESKGFAYIKFLRFSEAATAFENCDRKYKPKFAEPRRPKDDLQKISYNAMNETPTHRMNLGNDNSVKVSPFFKEDGVYKLNVVASPAVNQDQMWKLFDIVPSLDYCQICFDIESRSPRVRLSTNTFEVVYTNLEWAMYAVEKFHGFEYPPGHRLIVKMENQQRSMGGGGGVGSLPIKRTAASLGETSLGGSVAGKTELLQLAETIAQANSLIKAAGLNPDLIHSKLGGLPESRSNDNFCSVPLPDPKPFLHVDTKTEARCFVICFPQVLNQQVLKDVFCRFGDLIDVYMLHKKNCGYAKYASKESAEAAIRTLHGAQVMGVRLKVFEAEERPDKRQKLEADNIIKKE